MINTNNVRKRILELALKAASSGAHLGGSLSCVEILSSIYEKIDVSNRTNTRDRVILSKGHAALALYCILETVGIMSKKDVETFETNGTHLFAHASRNPDKGIEFSGGSLGLGISFATGVAMICKERQLGNHIYVIVGDGECAEGIFWETLETINKYQLVNMTIIVDCNGIQADGLTTDVMDMSPLSDKFKAFGLNVYEVDGHSMEALAEVLNKTDDDKAKVVIAHTVKGKGISFMENTAVWHHGVLNQKKFDKAMEELE